MELVTIKEYRADEFNKKVNQLIQQGYELAETFTARDMKPGYNSNIVDHFCAHLIKN